MSKHIVTCESCGTENEFNASVVEGSTIKLYNCPHCIECSSIEVTNKDVSPTGEGTPERPANYSEGQLREAIAEIVDYCSESYYPEHEYGTQWADRNKEYLKEATDQLLALFHTYGNRDTSKVGRKEN